MFGMLIQPLRQLVQSLLANDSSRQISVAVAIGVVLGLTPKGNLIALTLGVLLLALRVNRPAGFAVAFFFSWLSPMLDGFTHKLGARLLAFEPLAPWYATLYDMPLGPWVGFNNTVVLGSLTLGLYIAYPVYLMTRMTVDRFQPPLAAWLRRRRIARALAGVDVSSRLGDAFGFGG